MTSSWPEVVLRKEELIKLSQDIYASTFDLIVTKDPTAAVLHQVRHLHVS